VYPRSIAAEAINKTHIEDITFNNTTATLFSESLSESNKLARDDIIIEIKIQIGDPLINKRTKI